MKYTLLFILLVTIVALTYAQESPPPDIGFYESSMPLKRVARQFNPPMPEMPPIPTLPKMMYTYNRDKRDAKGVGGALPTRKG